MGNFSYLPYVCTSIKRFKKGKLKNVYFIQRTILISMLSGYRLGRKSVSFPPTNF